jgi:hypothetical protein
VSLLPPTFPESFKKKKIEDTDEKKKKMKKMLDEMPPKTNFILRNIKTMK